MERGATVGVFEWQGKPLEAWIAARRWHVRYEEREIDARTLDEALEVALNTDTGSAAEALRVRLAVHILLSLRDQ